MTDQQIVTASDPSRPEPGSCPEHPHCLLARCQHHRCNALIHVHLRGPGRLRQFCSTRCRVAQHRWNQGC